MTEAPLRVGLMVDQVTLPYWQARVVEMILQGPRTELAAVIINAEPAGAPVTRFRHALYRRYRAVDRKRYAPELARHPPRDLSDQLAGAVQIATAPLRRGRAQMLDDDALRRIQQLQLDLIVRLGFSLLHGGILTAARYGVWSWHHGDNDAYRGSCPGFWEVFDDCPRTGATLQVLTESIGDGHVLGKTEIRTHAVSPTLNLHEIELAGVRLFRDAIHDLARDRPSPSAFLSRHPRSTRPYQRRLHRTPTNAQMLRFLCCNLLPKWLRLRRETKRTSREQWLLGVADFDAARFPHSPLANLTWHTPDPSRFVADPFPIQTADGVRLLVEDYEYAAQKGVISVANPADPESLARPRRLLTSDNHLSFPFVLRHESKIYAVPEERNRGDVVLYRADDTLGSLEPHRTLLAGVHCVDTIVHQHDGNWYLFTSISVEGHTQNNLYLFVSETLDGDWRPHPSNPIRNTLRGARMAGGLLKVDDALIRPGQNCEPGYGYSVVFHRIDRLTPDAYDETEVGELGPDQLDIDWLLGFHTFNLLDGKVYVDGLRQLPL